MSVPRVCTLVGWCLLGAAPVVNAVEWAHFQVANLYGTGIDPGQQLGRAVAIDGDVIVVATPLDVVGGITSGSAFVYRRFGHLWFPEAQLTPSDPAAGDFFGVSVAVRGNRIAVGATGDDDAGSASGAVYVFDFVGGAWRERHKLRGADTNAGDAFGYLVSFGTDDLLAVGAPGDFVVSRGSVYVLRWSGSTWNEEAKLTRPGGFATSGFAEAVGATGDRVVVGAQYDDLAGTMAGAVYVYRRDGQNWAHETTLIPDDTTPGQEFGTAVAMDGNTIVVGTPRDNDAGPTLGSAYVFELLGTTWVQIQELFASDVAHSGYFGWSVAIKDRRIVVGGPVDNQACPNNTPFCPCLSGAAYLFMDNGLTWIELAKITPMELQQGDFVGVAVGVTGDYIVVGATHEYRGECDTLYPGPGAAHVFRSVPPIYADVNRDATVNLDDALCLLDTFAGAPFPIACLTPSVIYGQLATFSDKDIAPCPSPIDPLDIGDGFVNSDDLLSVLNRFAGVSIDPACASVFP